MLSNVYMHHRFCDACIHLTTQIKSLKETCQSQVRKLLNTSENRFKRMIIHSVSPNERKKNCNSDIARKETSIKNSKKSLKFSEALSKVNQQIICETRLVDSSEIHGNEKDTAQRTPSSGTCALPPLVDHMYSGTKEQVQSSDSENKETPRNNTSLLVDHMYAGSTEQPEASPGEDHLYSLRDTGSVYKEHSIIKTYTADKRFPSQEILNLRDIAALSDTDCVVIATKIMQLPQLSAAIRNSFLQQISHSLNKICGTGHKSVLRAPLSELYDKTYLNKVISEMEQRCSFVLDILLAMCCPAHHTLEDTNYTVAAIYGMVMHARNPQLAAFQKMVSVSCVRHHAGNGVSNFT